MHELDQTALANRELSLAEGAAPSVGTQPAILEVPVNTAVGEDLPAEVEEKPDLDIEQLAAAVADRLRAPLGDHATQQATARVQDLARAFTSGLQGNLDATRQIVADGKTTAEDLTRRAGEAEAHMQGVVQDIVGTVEAAEARLDGHAKTAQADIKEAVDLGTSRLEAATFAQTRKVTQQAQSAQVRIEGAVADGEQAVKAHIAAAVEQTSQHVGTIEARARDVAAATELLAKAGDATIRAAVIKYLENMGEDPAILPLVTAAKASLKDRHEHAQAPLLDALVRAGIPAYLHGEAGSGKSTGASYAAEKLGLDFRSISFGPTTGKADLLSFRDAGGNVARTGFRQICEFGGVMLFDEIDAGNPGLITVMNASLANGYTEFPDTRIMHHANTRFVAAANTIGKGADAQYVGRNPLDAATRDRFAFLQWDIDDRLEEALVLGKPVTAAAPFHIQQGGVPTAKEWLDTVRGYREAAARLRIAHLITPRAAIYGARLTQVDVGDGKVGVGHGHLVPMLIHKGISPEIATKLDNDVKVRSSRR